MRPRPPANGISLPAIVGNSAGPSMKTVETKRAKKKISLEDLSFSISINRRSNDDSYQLRSFLEECSIKYLFSLDFHRSSNMKTGNPRYNQLLTRSP